MKLFKALLLFPLAVLAMDEPDDMLGAPQLDKDMQGDAVKEMPLQDRNTRDANPGLPPIILHESHPSSSPSYHPDHPESEQHKNPDYTPKKHQLPTKAKCRVEEVEVKTKICTPTYQKKCRKVTLPTKELVNRDKCFKIIRTVCKEKVETLDNELCVYEYNMDELDALARSVKVEYKKRCESTRQEYCPPQQGYGHGYCKHQNTKVCYNEPRVSSKNERVKMGRPVPKKACQNNRVRVPKVECEDVEVEKCISLPYTENVEVSLDKCRAELGKHECEETVLTLPKQVCEEIKESNKSSPVHGEPTAAYHQQPAYHQPTRPAYAG